MKMVLLDYTFLFNGDSTWSHLSQFENDLAQFFSSYGMECEIVSPMGGQPGRRILLIKRRDPVLQPQQTQSPQGEKTMKQMISQMTKKTWQDGKFRKDNPTMRNGQEVKSGGNS